MKNIQQFTKTSKKIEEVYPHEIYLAKKAILNEGNLIVAKEEGIHSYCADEIGYAECKLTNFSPEGDLAKQRC